MTQLLIEEDQLNALSKIQADNTRSTIPQPLLDRIEKEWQQMRANAAPASRSFPATDDKS